MEKITDKEKTVKKGICVLGLGVIGRSIFLHSVN